MDLQTETDVPVAPMIIRGQVITEHLIEVGGRGGDLRFQTPDANQFIERLALKRPEMLSELYKLSIEDILDYLDVLSDQLDISSNVHLQRARRLSYQTAPTTPPLVDRQFAGVAAPFKRAKVRELIERTTGVDYLEGWVEHQVSTGARMQVRCFGARALHIVAGNSPVVSVMSIIRNAILRSDALIKAPSNDPFTALAIAQTMCEMAPRDHPLTRHLSVAYWRGGDVELERQLYQPHNFEKIIAWGGYSSLKHVTQYIQPGLELIALDPKRSASVVGREAFASEETMHDAARRLATDIGLLNQVACVNSRVSYIMSGTDEAGVERLNRFGKMVYEAILKLPESISSKPKSPDRDLKEHVDALRLDDEWFKVIGGLDDEGAVIVSQIPEEVEFSTLLNDRTANLVPVDSVQDFIRAVNAYTQTVGVYPESLKAELLDILPLSGAQRFVSLGYAGQSTGVSPQDSLEIVRRMGRWIVNEISTPDKVPPLWEAAPAVKDLAPA